MIVPETVQPTAKALSSTSVRASIRERGFVILKPEQSVREIVVGMPLKKKQDMSKQFTE